MEQKQVKSEEKMELIRANFPNLSKINPYFDRMAVMDIKRFLCDVGAYKNRPCEIHDTAIINLIIAAQGKKKFMHYVPGAARRKSG